jgi:hypothetical protein
MRGDYQLPTGDWSSRDSLAEMTEVYERPEPAQGSAPMQLPAAEVRALATQPSPVVVAPIAYVPMNRPMTVPVQRYEIPTIAPYATGSSPQVRISERLDATHRVERASSWQRIALIAGIVGAIVLGVGVGVVVSMGGAQIEAAPVAATKPLPKAPAITVTPIEVPAPRKVTAPALVEPATTPVHVAAISAPVVHHEARAPREVRHEHAAPVALATGLLRIASKPPCAIAIDGKPSGKTTPQAALSLPVGSHQVTLTNEEQGIQLTTEVAIKADKPTSVVQDFTK